MSKPFDLAVVIGRFQPIHLGHLSLFRKALEVSARVGVLLGSAGRSRSIDNPFVAGERQVMIQAAIEEHAAGSGRAMPALFFEGVRDSLYDDQRWAARVQQAVSAIVGRSGIGKEARVALVGHDKDPATAAYLKMFPQWELCPSPAVSALSATDIRRHLLDVPGDLPDPARTEEAEHAQRMLAAAISAALQQPAAAGRAMHLKANLAPSTASFLKEFEKRPEFGQLVLEQRFVDDYRRQFAGLRYPPTFQTADAVVVQSGHVLLIKRRALPGKGLWALPGGFVKQDERLLDAAVRELREETGLKVPAPVLRGSVKAAADFDHPRRSARGRTFTKAFHIVLPDGELPAVKGGDDAEKARWVPMAEAAEMSALLFEDHFDILDHFLGLR